MNLSAGFHTDAASVTAIIPTYNRAQYIEEALSSILGQTFPPVQVIVVDDGSTDNTREVVAGFGSRAEYLAKSNGGKSSALNVGLGHAAGEFIWIFDDDDIAEPDVLERLLGALQNHPECGFAYGGYDLFTTDEAGRMSHTPVSFPSVNPPSLYLALMERSFILQQGLLVRKSCYDETGGFDETLIRSQDLDMILRLTRRYSGIKIDGIAFHLRQHRGVRGSKTSLVAAKRVVDGWVKSDRKIIGQIYATHDLKDFVPSPRPNDELPDEERFTAFLQRACITARKGMWHEAAQDLRWGGEIAQANGKTRLSKEEISILRRIFDLFSYAPHTFGEAAEFRHALKEIKPALLQRRMRAAILWSLPFTIGAVLLHRQYRNFLRFLRIYFALATPHAVVRTIFSRSFFNAGLDLVRNRRSSTAVHQDSVSEAPSGSTA